MNIVFTSITDEYLEDAKKAMKVAADKMPVKCQFITRLPN